MLCTKFINNCCFFTKLLKKQTYSIIWDIVKNFPETQCTQLNITVITSNKLLCVDSSCLSDSDLIILTVQLCAVSALSL